MSVFTYDNHISASQAFFESFVVEGRLGYDGCFRDINNSELEGMGARYFWSDYSKMDFVDGFKLNEDRRFQLCGVSVEGSVFLLLIVITEVPGFKSKLDVMLQIEFESKMFLDVSVFEEVFDELLEHIVIPFYSSPVNQCTPISFAISKILEPITTRLYHAIQYEFVRLELNDMDPKIIQFLKPFSPKTLERLHLEE
jgi:hypothetical protein